MGRPLDDIFSTLVDAGFDAIDVPCEPATYPVAAVLEATGSWAPSLRVAEVTACINPGRDLVHPVITNRQAAVTYIKHCIDLAAAIGNCLTHLCFITSPENLHGTPRAVLEGRAIDSIRECHRHAVDAGVRLLVEPLFKDDVTLVTTAGQGISLYARALGVDEDAIGHDNTGLLLDLFHGHREEVDLQATIEKHARATFHVHVADAIRSLDFSRSDSDFVARGLARFDTLGFAGYASFESFDASVSLESLGHSLATLKARVHS